MTDKIPLLEGTTPVAWRWRYVRESGPDKWTVRQSPVAPFSGSAEFSAIEVEPLYLAPSLARKASSADRLVEALEQIIAEMQYPNSLERGFSHGKPTLADMTKRVAIAEDIARQALPEWSQS